MKRVSLLLFVLAAAAAGCRVRDVRTATIRVPGLRNGACSNEIARALSRLPDSRYTNDRDDPERSLRIERIDYATGDLTVRYDSMKVGVRNLEDAIARAGFDTPTFPADEAARAKLPAACRDGADAAE
ncbi:MAG: heavy-metal-associated domain-containing protein [Kiritimatiellae bacterium]|nr:heavy-metal-associated domain-containing protein [Kiritimatiellia bacterium]